jgi:hypothetical protein
MSGVLEVMGGEVRSVMGVEEEMEEVVGVDIFIGVVGCDGDGCDGDGCDGDGCDGDGCDGDGCDGDGCWWMRGDDIAL